MVKRRSNPAFDFVGGLFTVLIASVVLIGLGLVYFMLNLWIVKFGSALLNYVPDANWAVLSAALLTVAGLAGGTALKRK